MSAVIVDRNPKEDLIHRINQRLKLVKDKGASPTILLCLEALLFLLEEIDYEPTEGTFHVSEE
jgi:hypothetical protein